MILICVNSVDFLDSWLCIFIVLFVVICNRLVGFGLCGWWVLVGIWFVDVWFV